MRHIRFISNNQTVCESSQILGEDFVVIDYAPEDLESCKECLQLIQAHNKREYERDGMIVSIQNPYQRLETEDGLAPARGIMIGVAIGSIMWSVIFLLIWLIFVR